MSKARGLSPQITARALLETARDYRAAADAVLADHLNRLEQRPAYVIRPAVNFLYFHVIELCLKAAIAAYGRSYPLDHDIIGLHAAAVKLGFRVPEWGETFQNENTLKALQSQNVAHAFRYFDGVTGNSLDSLLVQPYARVTFEAAEKTVVDLAPDMPPKPGMRVVFPGLLQKVSDKLPWE